MKRLAFVLVWTSLMLLARRTQSDVIACDPQGCISETKLSENIVNTLKNDVAGYVVMVGGLPWAAGGAARTSVNRPASAMSPDLRMNIASVSKTLTTVAILQLLAKDGLTVDARILPYIYSDWSQGRNVDQLTFKELLTHTSGFGQMNGCGDDITYSALKTLVAGGVQSSNVGVPQYGNCNFALLRELLPALLGQSITKLPDFQRAQASSHIYITYMNQHVFAPVGVPASACKPAGKTQILSYPFPPESTPGNDWGDWSLECGSGGWVLSAGDTFKVINAIATNHILLTPRQRSQMISDCLGWDCSVRSDCPNPYACKNGDLFNGSGIAVWSYAGILKCDVAVIVYVNSFLPSPYQPYNTRGVTIPHNHGDIIGLVSDAYKAASIPGAPQACPAV